MGYIYTVGRNGREALACDLCGNSGGVRKRSCPVGWCPPAALCVECNKGARQTGEWAKWHAGCPERSAAFKAQRAAEQAEPDLWVRSASYAEDGTVRVVTHAGTIIHVSKAAYNGSVRGFGYVPA
jgi:hypothetical protein